MVGRRRDGRPRAGNGMGYFFFGFTSGLAESGAGVSRFTGAPIVSPPMKAGGSLAGNDSSTCSSILRLSARLADFLSSVGFRLGMLGSPVREVRTNAIEKQFPAPV